MTRNVSLYLGGRYDYWETSGAIRQYVAPAFDNQYATRDKSAFSPKASVVYRAAPTTVLRGSVGQAFVPPTLSAMYSTWVSSSGKVYESNPDLKPERTTSWELGAEHSLRPGTTVRATYYENYLTDLIYSSDVSATLNVKRNAGKAEVKGVELELRQKLWANITAFANFTYNHAVITQNSALPETEGKKMTYTPAQQFNIGVQGRDGPWHGSIIGRYVGDVYANAENLDTVDGVYGSYDPYVVVDAKIGYRVAKWLSASLSIDNLFDREYYQSSKAPGRAVFGELGAFVGERRPHPDLGPSPAGSRRAVCRRLRPAGGRRPLFPGHIESGWQQGAAAVSSGREIR